MLVLVVDDSDIVRQALHKELVGQGYVVDEAANGTEALARVERRRPDLITLDVTLPDFDGYEVCTRLRSDQYPPVINEIPIVFVTANDTLEGRAKGFEAGGADFVTKSEDMGQFVDAVNRILRPDQQLRGALAVVVDDSEISRALLRKHLTEHGVTVIEAIDGEAGLALVTEHRDEIDMVITDVRMPKVSGTELCAHMRKSLGLVHIPVIIVSVIDDVDSVLDVFKAGATDYLMKPYIREELIARVNSHLTIRLLNKRLNERLDELRRLNKVKDRFFGVCSDNLRPPIQKIVTGLDAIVQQGELSGTDTSTLRELRGMGKHALSLLSNLLSQP